MQNISLPNYAANIQLPSHTHEKQTKISTFYFLIKASEYIPN